MSNSLCNTARTKGNKLSREIHQVNPYPLSDFPVLADTLVARVTSLLRSSLYFRGVCITLNHLSSSLTSLEVYALKRNTNFRSHQRYIQCDKNKEKDFSKVLERINNNHCPLSKGGHFINHVLHLASPSSRSHSTPHIHPKVHLYHCIILFYFIANIRLTFV